MSRSCALRPLLLRFFLRISAVLAQMPGIGIVDVDSRMNSVICSFSRVSSTGYMTSTRLSMLRGIQSPLERKTFFLAVSVKIKNPAVFEKPSYR